MGFSFACEEFLLYKMRILGTKWINSFAKSVSSDDGAYDAIGSLNLQPLLIGKEVQLKPDCCTLAVIL